MTDLTQAQRREQGLDVLRTLRGGAADPDTVAAMERNLGALGSFVVDFALAEVWSRPGFSRRDRSLVVVSLLAAQNLLNQLRAHLGGGLNHGLTRDEVEEVCMQLAGYGGFPRAIDAMNVVRAVLAEREGVDVAELAPSPPAEPKDAAQRNADGKRSFERLTGREAQDPVNAIGEMGRQWAFGELWARPQLSPRDRSLVVVAILTALGREHELPIHLRGALNHGVSVEELEEVMVTAVVYAGFPAAVDGNRVLQRILAERNEGSGR